MWIGQGKHTISRNCRFVEQIEKIMAQFFDGLKAQSSHCESEKFGFYKFFEPKRYSDL
jgi:hypothetical protein